MKLAPATLALFALTCLGACERTQEQGTASAEKSAKKDVEEGHTVAQNLGELLAAEAWARETPPGAKNGAAYLTIVNGMHNGDTLLSVSASFAESASVHRTVEENGVMRMEAVEDGLPIPSGSTLKLEPNGLHIMLMGLQEPLKAGDLKLLTLTFRQAGEKKVPIFVRSLSNPEDAEDEGEDAMAEHMAGQHAHD